MSDNLTDSYVWSQTSTSCCCIIWSKSWGFVQIFSPLFAISLISSLAAISLVSLFSSFFIISLQIWFLHSLQLLLFPHSFQFLWCLFQHDGEHKQAEQGIESQETPEDDVKKEKKEGELEEETRKENFTKNPYQNNNNNNNNNNVKKTFNRESAKRKVSIPLHLQGAGNVRKWCLQTNWRLNSRYIKKLLTFCLWIVMNSSL